MKNNKGFTLLELIVSIAVLAVLATIIVPQLTKYIGASEESVCEVNRKEFIRSYNAYLSYGGTATLAQAVSGACPELAADAENLKCPEGGAISVVDGELVCSIHGAIGSESGGTGGSGDSGGGTGGSGDSGGGTGGSGDSGGGSGGSGGGTGGTTLNPGDTIFETITLESWTDLCSETGALPYAGASLTKGEIFVHNGITYAVKWNSYLSNYDAIQFIGDPDSLSYLQDFDSAVTIDSSSFYSGNLWNPALMNGTVFAENGSVYVFLGGDNTQYEAHPTVGGNWLKIK